jgi:hypothetical protein
MQEMKPENQKPIAVLILANHIPNMCAWMVEYASHLKKENVFEIIFVDLAWQQSRYFMKKTAKFIDNFSTIPSVDYQLRKSLEELNIHLVNLETMGIKRFQPDDAAPLDTRRDIFETSVRGSYARNFGSSQITMNNLSQQVIKAESISFKSTKRIMEELNQKMDLQLIVTTNGRFPVDAAIIDHSKLNSISSIALERAPRGLDFYLEFHESVHSIRERQCKVNEFWNANQSIAVREKAINWATQKLGTESSWHQLQAAEAPENLSDEAYWAFFPTSDWEISPFSDTHGNQLRFMNQIEAFRAVSELAKLKQIKLIVRGHPQPDDFEAAFHEDSLWREITDLEGATYIGCNSDVNSMKFAQNAKLNFTFESTVAAECVWRGFPIILLGETPYSHLIPSVAKFTKSEVLQFIDSPMPNVDREALLPWAYFESESGNAMNHFQVHKYDQVFFEKKAFLKPNRIIEVLRNSFVRIKTIFFLRIRKIIAESVKNFEVAKSG